MLNQFPHSSSLFHHFGISSFATTEPEKEQGNTAEMDSTKATNGVEEMKAPDQAGISGSLSESILPVSGNQDRIEIIAGCMSFFFFS